MTLNTYEVIWQCKDKSEENRSQDYTVNTNTCVQGVCKSATFLTLSAE